MKSLFALLLFCSSALAQDFTNMGMNGLGGQIYDHAVVSSAYLNNPLSGRSQVSFYGAITCNPYALDHCAGFESGIGVAPNTHTALMNGFRTSGVNIGANAVIDRYNQFAYSRDLPGSTSNAILGDYSDTSISGNWFISYKGTLPSQIGGEVEFDGDIGVGAPPIPVANSKVISCDAAAQCFIRLFIGGVERGRITASSAGMNIDSIGVGTITVGTSSGQAIQISGTTITLPSLAGNGNRTVYVNSSGTLYAQ